MNKINLLTKVKGGLIVSCQALEDEPLHGAVIMGKMALAAQIGGAVAIRANTVEDILEIKKNVNLPIIGIIKKKYPSSQVYITPTIKEVDALIEAGVDVIATDATSRERPDCIELSNFVSIIREKYPLCILMADVSTFEEGMAAQEYGFDIVATTMSGYTEYSDKKEGPNFELSKKLADNLTIPLIIEGKINTPEDALKCIRLGAWSVVVGGAITRPQLITERFVRILQAKV